MNNEDVTQVGLDYTVNASHMEGDIKVIDDVTVTSMSIDAGPSYGDVIKQIVETQGQERNVNEIWPSDDANYMPKGCLHYIVRSKSDGCTHSPSCSWCDHVYFINGKYLIVKQSSWPFISALKIAQSLHNLENGQEQRIVL